MKQWPRHTSFPRAGTCPTIRSGNSQHGDRDPALLRTLAQQRPHGQWLHLLAKFTAPTTAYQDQLTTGSEPYRRNGVRPKIRWAGSWWHLGKGTAMRGSIRNFR